MSKLKVVSLDQFKKAPLASAPKVDLPIDDDEGLTEAGKSFRKRFSEALAGLEGQFEAQLAKAEKASDVKVRVNVSAALKIAQASPLTAYSDLHREVVAKKVEEAKKRCEEAVKAKFKVIKARPTIESLQKQLAQERAEHATAISKLASQKMTEYLAASGRK